MAEWLFGRLQGWSRRNWDCWSFRWRPRRLQRGHGFAWLMKKIIQVDRRSFVDAQERCCGCVLDRTMPALPDEHHIPVSCGPAVIVLAEGLAHLSDVLLSTNTELTVQLGVDRPAPYLCGSLPQDNRQTRDLPRLRARGTIGRTATPVQQSPPG